MRHSSQKAVTISLSKTLLDRIDEQCRQREMDRSTYIRQICLKEFGLFREANAAYPVQPRHPGKPRPARDKIWR